ncbi:restriction endonuclease subunit S [Paraburkholderia strydomiana]|uniref:restriction endonuclease subunit S n=1 Tax=Paraburkholderia strydomiana TaxID=1245417 RepID=UPI0038BBE2E4
MSLPRYSKYKDSGAAWLGDVPSTWQTRRARHLFEIKKRIAGVDGYDVLSITQQGIKVKDIESNDGQLSMDYSKYQLVEVGDFAMNHMDLLTGYVDVSKHFGVTSPDYRVFSIKSNDVSSARYFLYLLQDGYKRKIFYAFGKGASHFGRWRFPTEEFNSFVFPLPPRDEQIAIASFLDGETRKIDALIAEQEKLLALLAEKRQATLSHAVTRGLNPDAPMADSGVAWLGYVPSHWGKSKKLLDLAQGHRHSFVNGPFGSDLLTSELVSSGVPVIYIRDIKLSGYLRVSEWCVTPEKAEQLKFCNVIPGDVLVAKVGDPPGLAAVYPQGEVAGIVTQDVIRLRVDPEKANAEYIRWLLNSKYGQTQIDHISVESTRTRVGLGEYKQLRFFVPPLGEQSAIADFLGAETTKLDALKAEAERAIDLLRERRSTLIAAAVTGKIDVRNAVPQELAA